MFAAGMLVLLGGSLLSVLPPVVVRAADSQVQVLIGDVCPNIPGLQLTVPSGMIKDGSDNCVTPAPAPPPDACPNIAGYQSAIPDGYYRNQAGNCVPQTSPPQDVCPNLSGTQSSVPLGMYTAENGDCVWPPNDSCVNIPGPQNGMPDGMEYDESGHCVTPTTTPPPTKPTPSSPFFNLVPEWLKSILHNTPLTLARTLPYYLIALLMFIAILFFWQTIREALTMRGIFLIFKRKKRLAEEKDQFIALSARYLRETLTVMLANLRSLVSQRELTEETAQPLLLATQVLQTDIETFLLNVEQNKVLESDNTSRHTSIRVKTLSSPLFWVPVTLNILAILVVNVLLSVVGGIDLGSYNLLIQFLLTIAACLFLYIALRSRHIRHLEHKNVEKLVGNENTIDTTRNGFIQQASDTLHNGLAEIDRYRSVVADAPSGTLFNDGFEGLAHILSKFTLLSKVQTQANENTKFNIRGVLDNCLLQNQTAIDAKKMTITDTVESYELRQNRSLLSFVLGSVLDNIIKFSGEADNITVTSVQKSHRLEIHVSNGSAGIPKEKLVALLENAEDDTDDATSYDETGLSLFLDKILMSYIGGEIIATSNSRKGFEVVVTV